MRGKTKEKPLHEIVLDILYYENTEKPTSLTPEDIFLFIKDSDVNERKIREVLDWLVLQKRVVVQFGKYQLDKYEFIERANQEKQIKRKPKEKKASTPRHISIAKTAPRNNHTWSTKLALFFFALSLALLLWNAKGIHEKKKVALVQPKLETMPSLQIKNLHLPKTRKENTTEEAHLNQKIEEIAYLFHLQTEFNKKLIEQTDSLFMQVKTLKDYSNRIEKQLKTEQEQQEKFLKNNLLSLLLLVIGVFLVKK